MPRPPSHVERLPPPYLPWAWFALAHLTLLCAFALLALRPGLVGEFYYHPRAIAVVHLLTLGWITCNIIGSLYLVGPIALRIRFRGGRSGWTALALVSVGLVGMIAHFWIDSYSGMVWSAGTVLAGIALIAVRVLPAVWRSGLQTAVQWHLGLAFLNILLAGLLGSLVGLEKIGVLTVPGALLPAVHAHAHLAVLGWATMMVMGVGYRLLPMQLPSAIPPGSGSVASAWLMEAGILGLTAGLLYDSPWTWLAVLAIVAGLSVFGRQVRWMLANRRRPPPGLPQPDLALGHTFQALLYLALATVLGLVLLWMPPSALKIRLATLYGVLGLVGFLAQIIVGVGNRLLPMAAWTRSFVESGFEPPPVGMHDIVDRRLQAAALAGWSLGVPALAAGLTLTIPPLTAAAAALLTAAAGMDGWNRLRALRLAGSRTIAGSAD